MNEDVTVTSSEDEKDSKEPAKRLLLSMNNNRKRQRFDNHSPLTATSTLPLPNGLSSSPIKLFCTLQDEEIRKRESNPTHWSRSQCWTIREMLGLDGNYASSTIEWLVISNYIIDFDYLLDAIPEILSIPRVVVFYGSADTSHNAWKSACAPGSSVDFCRLDPSEFPDTPYNPTGYRIPFGVHHSKFFLIGFRNETLRVVIHTANLRQSDVHVKVQAAYIQQFPMKPRTDTSASSSLKRGVGSDFETTLIAYLESYRFQRKYRWVESSTDKDEKEEKLTERIGRYDFSTASVILIPSTPGYHSMDRMNEQPLGRLKLRKSVGEYAMDSRTSSIKQESNWSGDLDCDFDAIVCQFSSMGSLTEKYLFELQQSMDAAPHTASKAKQPPSAINHFDSKKSGSYCNAIPKLLKLQIVYPTVDEIRESVEGYRGGGSVPGTHKNVSKPFLRPLFRKWRSISKAQGEAPKEAAAPEAAVAAVASSSVCDHSYNPLWKGNHVPHIKTYYQLRRKRGGSFNKGETLSNDFSFLWFVMTSHNLSKAAWGDVVNSVRHGGSRLFIRHWELGVFAAPSLLGVDYLVPWTPDQAGRYTESSASEEAVATIPVPFKVSPDAYEKTDIPWAVDLCYSRPDRYGRCSVTS